MAYIAANYHFEKDDWSYDVEGNVAFIVSNKLVDKIEAEGELVPAPTGGGDYWEYVFYDDAKAMSFGGFWSTVTEQIGLNVASQFYEMFALDRNFNIRNNGAYKLFKTGGFRFTQVKNPNDSVNMNVTISSKYRPDTILGYAALTSDEDRTWETGAYEFVCNGENYAFRGSAVPTTFFVDLSYKRGGFSFFFHSQEWIEGGEIDTSVGIYPSVGKIQVTFDIDGIDFTTVKNVKIVGNVGTITQMGVNYTPYVLNGLKVSDYTPGGEPDDVYNPYDPGMFSPDGTGGGDGTFDDSTDKIELTPILNIESLNSNLYSVFSITRGQLDSIANFLYSDSFDINLFKRIRANPLDSIVGLTAIPVPPFIGGSRHLKFGGVDTGISLSTVTNQFLSMQCGGVKIDKYWGNFADYDPFTQIEIYLPFIGTRTLNANDCMGRTLSLEYRIDVITGACVAIISVSGLGPLYSFSGSCAAQMPFSANDYSQAVGNAINAAMSLGSTAVGLATGNPVLTKSGVAGLAATAASALSAPPLPAAHSGSVSGTAGFMGHRNAYVTITRPKQAVAHDLPSIAGLASSYSATLGSLKGFTQVGAVHLENILATDAELSEINMLLREGVIL